MPGEERALEVCQPDLIVVTPDMIEAAPRIYRGVDFGYPDGAYTVFLVQEQVRQADADSAGDPLVQGNWDPTSWFDDQTLHITYREWDEGISHRQSDLDGSADHP